MSKCCSWLYAPFICWGWCSRRVALLALVAVLAQALLTLVRGHLVALFLFSVWHDKMFKMIIVDCSFRRGLLAFAHFLDETLAGLEGRQVVCFDDERGVLGNVACCLACAVLDDEASESTQVYVFLVHGQ